MDNNGTKHTRNLIESISFTNSFIKYSASVARCHFRERTLWTPANRVATRQQLYKGGQHMNNKPAPSRVHTYWDWQRM